MDDFELEDGEPKRVYAPAPPPRKPILVIDLQPHQLDLSPDLLELMGQHAAGLANRRIEEVHWRIGPHIVAKTKVTERLPEVTPPHILERERKIGRPSKSKQPKPGEFDKFGRYKVWFV